MDTDLHCFFDADYAENAEFLVSLVFLANFALKASFVTKLCLRTQGRKNGLLMKLTKKHWLLPRCRKASPGVRRPANEDIIIFQSIIIRCQYNY
jgi:hypothetical protein